MDVDQNGPLDNYFPSAVEDDFPLSRGGTLTGIPRICFNMFQYQCISPRTLVLLRRSIYRVTRVNRLSKAFEGSDGTNLRRAMQAMLGKKTEELESLVRDSCGASALVV